MKSIFSILIISVLFISCSSNTWIKKTPVHESYVKEINYLGNNRHGLIILKNENEIETSNLYIESDSVIFTENFLERYKAIALQEVKCIQFKDHVIGTIYGIFGGIAVGTALGYITIDWDAEMAGLGL